MMLARCSGACGRRAAASLVLSPRFITPRPLAVRNLAVPPSATICARGLAGSTPSGPAATSKGAPAGTANPPAAASGLLRRFLDRLGRKRRSGAPALLESPHPQLRSMAHDVLGAPCPTCGAEKPGRASIDAAAAVGAVNNNNNNNNNNNDQAQQRASETPSATPSSPVKTLTVEASDAWKAAAAEAYSCPGCGYPSHCSAACRDADAAHVDVACEKLALIHTDEHMVRQRPPAEIYAEFDKRIAMPALSAPELGGWGEYLSTRGLIRAEEFSNPHYVRYLSNALTYPLTIAAHARSSLGAFADRAAMELEEQGSNGNDATESDVASNNTEATTTTTKEGENENEEEVPDVFTIHVVGARAEARLPLHLWHELAHLHPSARLHLVLSGPEVPAELHERQREVGLTMLVTWLSGSYTETASQLADWGVTPGLVAVFHSGIGSHGGVDRWGGSIAAMLRTGAPVLFTSFDEDDLRDDLAAIGPLLEAEGLPADSAKWEVPPTRNPFRSLMGEVEAQNINRVIAANHSVFVVRKPPTSSAT